MGSKILVPTDGSKAARKAAVYAVDLAGASSLRMPEETLSITMYFADAILSVKEYKMLLRER